VTEADIAAFIAFCEAAETPMEYNKRMNSQEAFLAGRWSKDNE